MKEEYDTLDKFFCNRPLIGKAIKRVYAYFKKHIAITDAIHLSLGLGIGLLIAGSIWFYAGFFFIISGFLGHIYAFMKGGE